MARRNALDGLYGALDTTPKNRRNGRVLQGGADVAQAGISTHRKTYLLLGGWRMHHASANRRADLKIC
jgi:hypothetical protein